MLKAGLITQSGGRLADWHSSVLTDLLESPKSFNAVAVDVIVIFIIVVVIVVIIIDIAIKKRKAWSRQRHIQTWKLIFDGRVTRVPPSLPTSHLLTYENPTFGLKIQYPINWEKIETNTSNENFVADYIIHTLYNT